MINIAIKVGCFPMIEYLIDSKDFKLSVEDINTRDINGELLIISAFYNEKLEIFNYLLDHGADSNATNKNGVPLLSLAIHKNDVEVIKSLLNNHVNIYNLDTNGISPFMKAVNKNYSDIVELFTAYGNKNHINILMDEMNTDSSTILQEDATLNDIMNNDNKINDHSINEENSDITLINNNPLPPNPRNVFNGNSPLIKAIKRNNFEMVYSLLKYCKSNHVNLNIVDVYGNTPLIICYMRGYEEIFRILVEYVDINQRDIQGNTILHYAVEKKDLKTIKCLLSVGADVNALNKLGVTVLDRAISKGEYNIVKYLLLNDSINVNQRNKNWEIPLITVINDSHYSQVEKECIVEKLIEKGTNINLVDKNNKFALFYAIQNNNFVIVRILLENGATLNIKDPSTRDLICNIQNQNIVRILYNYGLELYNADNINFETLKRLIHLNNTHLFKLILDNNINIDINMKDSKSGKTLLQEANKYARIEISDYLIQRGAETSEKKSNNTNIIII
jgi:ankyrin repeat protein